jgi:2-polyprenyl-3-methyl-5-hydroxy-6-metoxy-1,4-benzoquinol methylase
METRNYKIANSMWDSVLREFCLDSVLAPEQSTRMRHYYRHLLNRNTRAFFRHHFSHRIAFILEQMRLNGGITLLDVGCGMGTQAILYSLLGYSVTGLDVNAQDIAIAMDRTQYYACLWRRNLNVNYIVANAPDYALGNSKPYDVVVALESLSHIQPIETFLDNVGNLLAPGGLFIVSDTNSLNPVVRLKLHHSATYKRVLSAPSLSRMLHTRGFKCCGILGSGFIPPVVARNATLFRSAKTAEGMLCKLPGHYLAGVSYTIVATK